ncbi:hypothetical protein [Pengzhenrongella sp.]|jgi:hypothetical protein|uniref:hypothetical protein n=1 Tax=Pengzhenrongella sp. TaxID=2888820 RepID=UPI002F9398C1
MNGRLMVGGVAAAVAVIVGVVVLGPWAGDEPVAPEPTLGPVVTLSPGASAALSPTPTPTPTATDPPGSGKDDDWFEGLAATLTPQEDAASTAFAVQVVTALTTQTVGEDRYARLKPFFTPDSSGPAQAGPAENNPGATASPVEVNWTKVFDPHDPQRLGLLISVQYDISKPGGEGRSTFGSGDVEWKLVLARHGAGWLASEVRLVASSDT